MNRFLSALLLLLLMITLSACDNSTSDLEEEGGTTTLSEETSPPRDDDLAYQDIESRQTKGDQQVLLSLRDTSFSLELPLPAEWEIAEEEGELSLLRDGLPIGSVTTKSVNGPWRTVSTKEREANGSRTRAATLRRRSDTSIGERRSSRILQISESAPAVPDAQRSI